MAPGREDFPAWGYYDAMMRRISNRGQIVLPEFVVAFFVAVTAIMAVSIYVQRTLQARERDAKIYMVDMMAQGCVDVDVSQGTTDCQGAAGMNAGKMAYEYEPYYVQVNSIVERDSAETKALTGPGIFTKSDSSQTQAQSQSNQISPVYAK